MKFYDLFISVVSILLFLGWAKCSHAQTEIIPLITQTGDSLNTDFWMSYSIRVDGDSLIESKLEQSSIELPIPDSLIQLRIYYGRIQPFYNEYTPESLTKLSEITVHCKNHIRGATPRFFRKEIMSPIENVQDSLEWFKEWLDRPEIIGYDLRVYNSRGITLQEKRKLNDLHDRIDNCMGDKTRLIYMNEPYTCSDVDPFNYQTEITEKFIINQNTEAMRERANNLSLVIMMVRKWDESFLNEIK